MITVRRAADRGHADHGWLNTYHTFSFADYYAPDFMGFGALRVINQDRVAPSRGFGTHSHRDMEIVSYVLDGVLEHKDNMGHGSQMRPGDVQIMSAGTGVTHSEFNGLAEAELHFLQMWVVPATGGTQPRYEQRAFSEDERRGKLRLVVSPSGEEGSLVIGQDARLYVGLFDGAETATLELPAGRAAWLHVVRGSVTLGEHEFGAGDGAAIQDERSLVFQNGQQAELILWDLPGV